MLVVILLSDSKILLCLGCLFYVFNILIYKWYFVVNNNENWIEILIYLVL